MVKKILVTGFLLLLCACGEQPPDSLALEQGTSPALQQAPPQLLFNARIHTVDESRPLASAMVFSADGAILGVGDAESLRAQFPDARGRDLGGLTVIPGLIDSHAHLHGLAVAMSQANLVGTTSKEDIVLRLREHERNLGPEDWLLGRGWDQNDWPDKEFPTRRDLDQHFPDRPVWLWRIDGHAGWANSAALAMADRDLGGDWQPQGGFIHRDVEGRPTGVMIDGAAALIDALVPPISEQLLIESLDLALQNVVSVGLTGVHDMGISRDVVEFFRGRIEAGAFPTRVYAFTDGAGETLDWLCARGAIDHPSGRLVMRAAKLYEDGALGSRGAALLSDYADDPGNSGLLFLGQEALQAQIDKALGCGFQLGVHAIGDRGNREVLDALEAVMDRHPDNPGRHRVEHAQVLTAEDIPRFAALDVIPAMQPTHATSDMYWAEDRIGPERIRFAYAWRSLVDSGARMAFGSDFPVEEVNPMLGLYAAVTRQDLEGWPAGGWYPGEGVSRAEALRGFTLDAAYAGFMEERVGSLTAGKRADFVVLDRDIMQVPVAEIPRARVLETWLDGELVFRREGG
jgi:predicted amidohydrolase YtcJ